jgi:hypothetical protein
MSVRRSCGMDDWLSRAVDRARQLNVTEIVVAAAWKQKRTLGEMLELLRATPLPVKLLPDAAVRASYWDINSTRRRFALLAQDEAR